MQRTAEPTAPAAPRFLRALGADPGAPQAAGRIGGDAALVAVLVLLSCVPYVLDLGFYSDDWAFLAELRQAPRAWTAWFRTLLATGMATRPVQAVETATLYALFGESPTGYHIANSFILAGAVACFHLCLRALGCGRLLAVLVPLLFGVLPHYVTDRVWIAAFQANVAILLFFLSLRADLAFVTHAGSARWIWKAGGAGALVASVLAYEVTAGLFLGAAVVLIAYARALHASRVRAAWLAAGINVALLGAATLWKLTTTTRAGLAGGLRFRVLRIATEAVPVHFGELGLGLPVRVAHVLASGPDPIAIGTALLIGVATTLYVLHILRTRPGQPGTIAWHWVLLAGFAVFGLGYAMTLATWEIGFHATGSNNRTAIGAAIGTAMVFVGAIGWVAARIRSPRGAALTLAALAGLLTASCVTITAFVADHWVRAAREQDAIIAAVERHPSVLRAGSTLLLAGVCPFSGPAPVFATSWDATGMLQVTSGVRGLRGDVLKPNSELTPDGVRTQLFDDVINVYPFGADLYALDVRTGELAVLGDEAVTGERFAALAQAPPGCPPWTDGDGAEVFP